MPKAILAALCGVSLLVAGSPASAQQPPIPKSLNNTAGGVCVFIAESGKITDAFVVVSTGSARKDRDLVNWAKQIEWPAEKRAGEERNVWFAMALVSGTASPPQLPKRCGPALATERG